MTLYRYRLNYLVAFKCLAVSFTTVSKILNDSTFWNCPLAQLIVKMVYYKNILGKIGNNKP